MSFPGLERGHPQNDPTRLIIEVINLSDLSAYPNPFNSSVPITFTIDRFNKVILSIFDIQGREITRLETRDLELTR